MKVREIAIKDVHCTDPSADLSEVAAMMKRHNVGAIPICEGNKLVGIITDRDLVVTCMAAGMEPQKCQAREFMTSNPITIGPDMEIEDAARLMAREQIHRLPVIEDGKIIGMITLGDVSTALTGQDSLVAQTLRRISTATHALI